MAARTDTKGTGQPIYFVGDGYGVEPCPGCGGQTRPGDVRATVPGVWYSWHKACYDNAQKGTCPVCRTEHEPPYGGMCLI